MEKSRFFKMLGYGLAGLGLFAYGLRFVDIFQTGEPIGDAFSWSDPFIIIAVMLPGLFLARIGSRIGYLEAREAHERRERFRFIEGEDYYEFVITPLRVGVRRVEQSAYQTRLSREELDEVIERYHTAPKNFSQASKTIFEHYVRTRGIEGVSIPELPKE